MKILNKLRIDVIEYIKNIIEMSKLPIKTISWIFTFSIILILLVLIFPNWAVSKILSTYLIYIIVACIGSFLLLIINLIIYIHVKIKSQKVINTLIREWKDYKNNIRNLEVIYRIDEEPTDTNSSDFILGKKGLYQDVIIYTINPNQKILNDFYDLRTKTITILERLLSKFPSLNNYVTQINTISIDRAFENKNEIERYFREQIQFIINSLNSIIQIINEKL